MFPEQELLKIYERIVGSMKITIGFEEHERKAAEYMQHIIEMFSRREWRINSDKKERFSHIYMMSKTN